MAYYAHPSDELASRILYWLDAPDRWWRWLQGLYENPPEWAISVFAIVVVLLIVGVGAAIWEALGPKLAAVVLGLLVTAFLVGSAVWMAHVGDIDGLWAEGQSVMVIVPMALFCWIMYRLNNPSAASLQRKREWEERFLQNRQERLERLRKGRG
jgi:hypothetical protein